jgi:hypothetical protein
MKGDDLYSRIGHYGVVGLRMHSETGTTQYPYLYMLKLSYGKNYVKNGLQYFSNGILMMKIAGYRNKESE